MGAFYYHFIQKRLWTLFEPIPFQLSTDTQTKKKNKQKNAKVLKIALNLVHYLDDISFEFRVISLSTTTNSFLIVIVLRAY